MGTNVVIKSGIEDYRISVMHDTVKDMATATLVIKHLNRSDDGLYTCVATNKVTYTVIHKQNFELFLNYISIQTGH